MTPEEFDKVVKETFDKCSDIMLSKNKEYARNNDKLHNFKVAAGLQGVTNEKALGGMMSKHTISIYDYINDTESDLVRTIKQWDEKIIDNINYLLLLRGLIVEKG